MQREKKEFNASGDMTGHPLHKELVLHRKIGRPPPHHP
jgi:hypothetical protein